MIASRQTKFFSSSFAIDFAAGAGSAGVHGEREFPGPGVAHFLREHGPGAGERSKVI